MKYIRAWIAEKIGADSIKFNSLDTFVEAMGIPKEDFCTKCWDGLSPVKG